MGVNYSIAKEDIQDIQDIVDEVAAELGFEAYGLDFQVLVVDKANEVVKITKANKPSETVCKRDDLFYVICYGQAFDMVEEKDRYMWIRTAMETVSFNPETEKASLSCPMISVPQHYYDKVGKVVVDECELGLLTIEQIKEKEKEKKAEEKAKKAEEKKKNKKKY